MSGIGRADKNSAIVQLEWSEDPLLSKTGKSTGRKNCFSRLNGDNVSEQFYAV